MSSAILVADVVQALLKTDAASYSPQIFPSRMSDMIASSADPNSAGEEASRLV